MPSASSGGPTPRAGTLNLKFINPKARLRASCLPGDPTNRASAACWVTKRFRRFDHLRFSLPIFNACFARHVHAKAGPFFGCYPLDLPIQVLYPGFSSFSHSSAAPNCEQRHLAHFTLHPAPREAALRNKLSLSPFQTPDAGCDALRSLILRPEPPAGFRRGWTPRGRGRCSRRCRSWRRASAASRR